MSRRGKSDEGTELILRLFILFLAFPILGIYWTFKGNTETKRLIGIGILAVCFIGWIFSLFS